MPARTMRHLQTFATLEDLRRHLARQTMVDVLCPGSPFRLDEHRWLRTTEGTFFISPRATAQLARWAGVSGRNATPERVNQSLGAHPGRLRVRVQDGIAVAVLSAAYTPVAHLAVLDRLTVWPDLQLLEAWLTPHLLRLTLVMPKATVEPRVGDIVQAGVEVINSETGAAALVYTGYLQRLACANGALLSARVGGRLRHHGHSPEWLLQRFQQGIGRLLLHLPELAPTLARMAHTPLGASAHRQVRRQLVGLVGPRQTRTVLEGLTPQTSRYEAFNRITTLAQHYVLDRRRSLERLGGRLVDPYTR
ncbi:MAG: hypothetical protein HY660_18165 [Armatimonadetes bacterium]|nr:hypothetical protein [Armatimonadota bacterium]